MIREACAFCNAYPAELEVNGKPCCGFCKMQLEMSERFAKLQQEISSGFRRLEEEISGRR